MQATLMLLLMLSAPTPFSDAPSVEEAANNYLKAVGGAQKQASISTLKLTGMYVYNGIEHPMVIHRKRDDKVRFDIQGLNRFGTQFSPEIKVVRAYNGKEAWGMGESRQSKGAYALPAEAAATLKNEAPFECPLVDYKKKGHKLLMVGSADVDGADTWHLEVTLAGGGKQHWYLNKKTWLPAKMAVEGAGGRFAPGSWIFDEWRKVDGIMIAHFVFMEEGIFSREYFIEKVEVNPTVQDSVFNKPAS